MNWLKKKLSRLNWPIIIYLQCIIAFIIWICLTGCTSITYPTPTGPVTYSSFFTDRKLDSLTLTLADGTQLELQEYTSEQSKVAEAVARGVAAGLK